MLEKIQEYSIRMLIAVGIVMWPIILLVGIFGFISEASADDNVISIKQSGDNFTLTIDQVGYFNNIEMHNQSYVDSEGNSWLFSGEINGGDNTLIFRQNNQNGSYENVISIGEIEGQGNDVKIGQGYDINSSGSFFYDYEEYGNLFVGVAVNGDNNDVTVSQRTDSQSVAHEAYIMVDGDDNNVMVKQKQGGSQSLELAILNDNNDVELMQKNNGSHTATIFIDGLYGTDIMVTQSGALDQSYNVQQYCMNPAGCSITVLQNN